MTRSLVVLTAIIACLSACSKKPVDPPSAPAATAKEAAPLALPRTAAPDGASVYIVSPADGATLTSPFLVEFGAQSLTIVPAGDQTVASGHHHLIINGELPDSGRPIPANDTYIHFGKGQTQTELNLSPGEYTLQLIAGDHLHIPHDPVVASERISVSVVE